MTADALEPIRDIVLIVAALTVTACAVVIAYRAIRLTRRIEKWLDRVERFGHGVSQVTEVIKQGVEAVTGLSPKVRMVRRTVGGLRGIWKVFSRGRKKRT